MNFSMQQKGQWRQDIILCCFSVSLYMQYANEDAALNLSMSHLHCHLHTRVHILPANQCLRVTWAQVKATALNTVNLELKQVFVVSSAPE